MYLLYSVFQQILSTLSTMNKFSFENNDLQNNRNNVVIGDDNSSLSIFSLLDAIWEMIESQRSILSCVYFLHYLEQYLTVCSVLFLNTVIIIKNHKLLSLHPMLNQFCFTGWWLELGHLLQILILIFCIEFRNH